MSLEYKVRKVKEEIPGFLEGRVKKEKEYQTIPLEVIRGIGVKPDPLDR